MNINFIFIAISLGLLMIFFLFKPMEIKQDDYGEVALFEIQDFTLYELNSLGLNTFMKGNEGTRYGNRYEVKKINYTDNSEKYLANMVANEGIYKNEIVDLKGDVVYTREDGFTFKTQNASYNKKTTVAYAKTDYISYRGKDQISGTWLKYNNKEAKADSKNVIAIYQIQEDKK
ncbi:MAG: LPS export ABC transporter periplasmic protein LptC [Helicobacteraceae bacterium]|nr:LPS export ABC transporter periplasmic protein LptC [Helicobacteraceae bacterium]